MKQVQYWTTEVPTVPGLYWAYEGLDPLDADVILVRLLDEDVSVFWSIQHDIDFPADHFSHFMLFTSDHAPIAPVEIHDSLFVVDTKDMIRAPEPPKTEGE